MKTINLKETTPKIAKVAKKVGGAVMKVDLIDGQKRAESIARRFIILLLLLLSIYIFLDLLVDNGVLKTNRQRKVDSMIEIPSPSPVVALERTEQTRKPNDAKAIEPEVVDTPHPSTDKVAEYVKFYGGKYDAGYLTTLRKYCDEDTLKLVVAISVAESSMGKNTSKNTNWYGYFYKGDRKYDPDQDTMAKVICNGIGKYYSDVDTNYERAKRYTGSDNTKIWMGNVNEALSHMR